MSVILTNKEKQLRVSVKQKLRSVYLRLRANPFLDPKQNERSLRCYESRLRLSRTNSQTASGRASVALSRRRHWARYCDCQSVRRSIDDGNLVASLADLPNPGLCW
jgi:hypothetical protein